MNKLAKYIIIGAIVAIVGFLIWYFSSIIAYILISAVLSLVGKPIVDLLCKIKIKKWSPPKSLSAAIALIILWLLFISFFRIMIPLVIGQVNELSQVNVPEMLDDFSKPISKVEQFIHDYLPSSSADFSVNEFLNEKISNFLAGSAITDLFSSTASFMINLFIALFSISFITFFFLKDDSLFYDGIKMIFPEKLEQQLDHALSSINNLLRRYFVGIIIQSTCIMILDAIGLMIVGIKFDTAIVIGLIAGILNVIPYVGPLTSSILAVLIGVATNLNLDFSTQLLPMIIYILLVFVVTRVIDDVFFFNRLFTPAASRLTRWKFSW